MDTARVYFVDARADARENLLDKLSRLVEEVGMPSMFKRRELVAVKLHFGEYGNTSYINPVFVERVCHYIKESGALPFLTDTNTLYVGTRTNSVSHLETAIKNGFSYATTRTPIIIADGLRGESKEYIPVEGNYYDKVSIAREIVSADGLVVLTHFKCHELTGIGGALKNVGMGCATREGKLSQHSSSAPVVEPDGCTGCGVCVEACPVDAIDLGEKAFIREKDCIGCAHCVAVCPEGTIKIEWNERAEDVQKKMVEHVMGALKGKEGKVVFVNFLLHISPVCDCYGFTDKAIVPDVGILASHDPVAIDTASAELVCAEQGLTGTALKEGFPKGEDKFRGVHPRIDWTVQLDYAEKMGLGKRAYELIKL